MLTDEDRAAITRADESCGCNGVGEQMEAVIEAIVARRVKAALNEAADRIHRSAERIRSEHELGDEPTVTAQMNGREEGLLWARDICRHRALDASP